MPIVVRAGGVSGVPAVQIKCEPRASDRSGAAFPSLTQSATSGSAISVHQSSGSQATGFGVLDRLDYSNTVYYKVNGISGRLDVHALAYSLYSPIHPIITLLDSAGNVVETAQADHVYVGVSGYTNQDSALVATELPFGDYVLRVESQRLNPSAYPAGPISLDPAPFLLITGSLNEAEPSPEFPFNARCRMEENFPPYMSPPGLPIRRGMKESDGGAFCGRLADSPQSRGPGPGDSGSLSAGTSPWGSRVGWFLPWFMMAFIAKAVRWFELRVRKLRANLYT